MLTGSTTPSPQPPHGFGATFLNPLCSLSWSVEQAAIQIFLLLYNLNLMKSRFTDSVKIYNSC